MSVSLRRSINAKCKECIYDPSCGGGTWREQVAKCSSTGCPLWPVRPFPQAGSSLASAPRDPLCLPEGWLARPIDSPKWGTA